MADILHKFVIKAPAEKVYEAISTQEGLTGWWAKQAIARAEVGFVNTFTFGTIKNEIKVTSLIPYAKVEWHCINAMDEWIGTNISFALEEKDGKTIVRFAHSGWREATDMFAACNYDWARFMASLKSYCETGTGNPF